MVGKPREKSAKGDDLHPDAWSRFEQAVDVVAKSPPQHRAKKVKSPKNEKKSKRPT
jgi:hypothetical protein